MSFLVFDETGSTLAAAVMMAAELAPFFAVNLLAGPVMDRLPRKPFLVGGDLVNAALYALIGLYLLRFQFSYPLYLAFSLLISTLSAFDELAYLSILPMTIPQGAENKGYSVSSMIYPVLQVVMSPLAALLYELVGVSFLLLLQAGCSLGAALIENAMRLQEAPKKHAEPFSLRQWRDDLRQSVRYLRAERGLSRIYLFSGVNNGLSQGLEPLLVAFFRTAPGFSLTMYSFFSVFIFAGRTAGSLLHYHVKIPPKRRYSAAVGINLIYAAADALLLWMPYPVMLGVMSVCGFLGSNSYTIRKEAVQGDIPEEQRVRQLCLSVLPSHHGARPPRRAAGLRGQII